MATIKIEPIRVESKGGYLVVITGIDPIDSDCIVGTIDTPGAGLQEGQWNLSGIMRGGVDSCNLAMNTPELSQLAELARRLEAEG